MAESDRSATFLLFSFQLVKTAELSPKKNYIFGIHPHGIMSAGGFACFSTEGCGFAEAFPGMKSTLAILAGLFKLPLFREYLMAAGIYQVDNPNPNQRDHKLISIF